MKKTLAILLAIILVAVMLPTATFVGAATEEEIARWDDLFVKSEGVTIDYDSCSLTFRQSVTFKVTIPAGGFVQFNQKLSDLVPASDPNDTIVQVIPSDLTKSDFFVQLVSDENAKGDILPVDEVGGADPGNSASTVHFYANSTGLSMGRGHMNNNDSTQIAAFANVTYWGANLSNGLRLRFYQSAGKILTRAHGTGVNKVSQKTIAELNGEDGFFVRLRTRKAQETYTVTINSSDISDAYYSNGYILSDRASSVDASSIKCSYNGATGMSTYTATATLANKGSFVQFDKKLTDLVGGGGSVKIKVGDGNDADFRATGLAVQLVSDSSVLKDIAPVDEGNGADPGVKAMTWSFAGNGTATLYFGNGEKTPSSFDQSIPNILVPNGGIGLKFTLGQDNKVSATAAYSAYNHGGPKASIKTLSQIGGTDGVYFRLRNQKSTAVTYTIEITTKATCYQDGAYKFSDMGSKLVSTTRTVADGKVSETATVKVSGNGGYVQLDRKLVDLVGGGATVKIATQNNASEEYDEARFTVQLTADGTAETDIVPVDERNADPGVLGISWSFDGGSNVMYVGKGSRTNSAFDRSISNVLVKNGGIGLGFNLNQDGTVVYAPTYNPYQPSTPEASTKTLAQIGGENGVYFRLRNWLEKETTYVITATYANVFGADAENGTVTLDKTAALKGETVTATVAADDSYQLKAGSLKYVVDGKEFPITNRVGEETESNTFTFAMPEDAVTVKAEFVPADAVNTALLGASYNIENGEIGKDMRFVTRAYRKAGNKTLTRCGNYLLRKDSPLGQQLAEGVALTEAQIKELTNPTGEQVVKLVPTTVLNDRCADYVDFTLRIKNVGTDTYKGVEYICISYTEFEEDGVYEYFYSTPCIRSYDYVVGALN